MMMSDTSKHITVSTLNTNPADRHTTAVDGGGIIDDGGGCVIVLISQETSQVITKIIIYVSANNQLKVLNTGISWLAIYNVTFIIRKICKY